MKIVRNYALRNGLHEPYRIRGINFDDEYVFLVGQWSNNVSILRRETGEVVWTLPGHIQKHGPPTCFRSAFWHTDDRHSFLLREQVQVPVPEWVRTLPRWRMPAITVYEWYEWKDVVVEPETGTLLFLSESVLLVIPEYKAMLRGESSSPLYMHLFLPEKESRLYDDEGFNDIPPTVYRTRQRRLHQAALAAAHGRAAVLLETLTLFDFQTPTKGRTVDGREVLMPFAVYEWSNSPVAYRMHRGPVDPFRHCQSVVMDATSIYCVTSQSIEREAVDVRDFPPDYHAQTLANASRHVTGFHFDRGALSRVVSRGDIARFMPGLDELTVGDAEYDSSDDD